MANHESNYKMPKDIQRELVDLVTRCLKQLKEAPDYSEEIYLELPTDHRFGDFSTNIALKLSKILKRPPKMIAAELVACLEQQISKSQLEKLVTQVKIEGAGFINFYLKEDYFYEQLKIILVQGQPASGAGSRAMARAPTTRVVPMPPRAPTIQTPRRFVTAFSSRMQKAVRSTCGTGRWIGRTRSI